MEQIASSEPDNCPKVDHPREIGTLTRGAVFQQAWPIVLGQALTPLVGLADAAVIGWTDKAAALAGVALGTTIINLIFWTFGFLRMGVTGLTSQAKGRGDHPEAIATLLRALLLALLIGTTLLMLNPVIVPIAFTMISAPVDVMSDGRVFVFARLFGAPGALAFYAVNGWLIGLGKTRWALAVQVVLNLINILADIALVLGLRMGAAGVGLGTAIAEWSAFGCGLVVCRHLLGPGWRRMLPRHGLFSLAAMKRLMAVNFDIMIRTLAMLILFTWFANAGARLGAVPLAANHVLMEFVGISAFVLDGFAFTAEARVGMALGAGSVVALRRAIRLTAEFTLAGGALFSLLIWLAGNSFVRLITIDPAIRAMAAAMLPFCALVPLLGAPSWLLDGIFIGATRGKILRNAALVVVVAYLITDRTLRGWGNAGVWSALLASYVYRAVTLVIWLPGLVRDLAQSDSGHRRGDTAEAKAAIQIGPGRVYPVEPGTPEI